MLECIEVLRGTRLTLPSARVVLDSTAEFDGSERSAIDPVEGETRIIGIR